MSAPINYESPFKIDSEGYEIMPDVWNKSLLMDWLSGGGYESICDILNKHRELKKANDTFTLGAKRAIESNCKLYKENQELKAELKILTDFCSLTKEGNTPTAQDMVDWIGSLFTHEMIMIVRLVFHHMRPIVTGKRML